MSAQHDAVGAYVVGALQPEDLESFEAHLEACPRCQEEAAALGAAAAELGLLASAPPPPPGLRTAVLTAVPRVHQLPPAPRRVADVRLLDHARQRRATRRTRALTLLVAAVSVLALALGGTVVTLVRQQTPVATTPADTSLLSAPDARIVPATFPDGTQVSFVVSKSQNRALFVAHDLASPRSGRTYQLWTVRRGVPLPDSTVAGGADVSQWFHGSVADAGSLAVTVEPEGGSTLPTTPVLASGAL